MSYEIKIKQSAYGKKASTTIELPGVKPFGADKPGYKAVLSIDTYKGSSGIGTFASVTADYPDGSRVRVMFSDYMKRLYKAPAGTRATEKNLVAIQNEALKNADAIVADAVAFYEKAKVAA